MLTGLFIIVALQQILLVALVVYMVRGQASERAELLQRIQAPQTAVYRHDAAARPPDPPDLPFEDDEAFHSRDELVALLAAENRTV